MHIFTFVLVGITGVDPCDDRDHLGAGAEDGFVGSLEQPKRHLIHRRAQQTRLVVHARYLKTTALHRTMQWRVAELFRRRAAPVLRLLYVTVPPVARAEVERSRR